MYKTLNKLLWCGAVAAMLGGGATNAMYSAMPVDSLDAAMPDVPSTPVIQAGTLLETNQLYDLICTGNCNFEVNGHLQFNVSYADRIPSLVTIGKTGDSKGKIVFDKQRPMATITLPGGHESYITISLEKLQGKSYADAAKYLALGVREKGNEDFIDILYMPSDDKTKNNPMICLQMAYYNIVELVPLVIENDMSPDNATHTPVIEGREVIGWGSIEEATRAFDFGTTFRMNIEEAESVLPIKNEPWVKMSDQKLLSLSFNTFFCCANGLFLAGDSGVCSYDDSTTTFNKTGISGEFIAFFKGKYIVYQGNSCSTSLDGTDWNIGQEVVGTHHFYSESKYNNYGITCATLEDKLISIDYSSGSMTYSDDGINWIDYSSPLDLSKTGKITNLCYGNKKLIALTTERYVFISDKEGIQWSPPVLIEDFQKDREYDGTFLAFGNGRFLTAIGEKLLSSTDGLKWKNAEKIGTGCLGLGYSNGAFVSFYEYVYRPIPLIPTSLIRE